MVTNPTRAERPPRREQALGQDPEPEGGQTEVEAGQPDGRERQRRSERHDDEGRQGEGHEVRHAGRLEVGQRGGAEDDEHRVAERQLAGQPHEQAEAGEQQDHGHGEAEGQHPGAVEERRQHQGHGQDRR